jgi:hypothetical protein
VNAGFDPFDGELFRLVVDARDVGGNGDGATIAIVERAVEQGVGGEFVYR